MWLAVLMIGLAAAAHQAWSANIFTTVSDMFPKKATASVTGIGGLAGGIGGVLLTLLIQKGMFVHYESIGKIQTGYYYHVPDLRRRIPAGLADHAHHGAKDETDHRYLIL